MKVNVKTEFMGEVIQTKIDLPFSMVLRRGFYTDIRELLRQSLDKHTRLVVERVWKTGIYFVNKENETNNEPKTNN